MARNLVRSSSQYLYRTSAVLSATPFTAAGWLYPIDLSSPANVFSFGSSANATNYFDMAGTSSGVRVRHTSSTLTEVTNSAAPTTGAWNHIAGVWASNSSRSAYTNGGGKATNTTANSTPTVNRTSIGAVIFVSAGGFPNGYVAEVGLWNVALTDAEIAILALGVSPLMVRPGSLVAYWPLIGRYSPEIDLVGGYDLTLANAPTAANHPRVLLAAPPVGLHLVGTAAATSTVALAWTINSGDSETGFSIERSATSATAGFSEITTVAANTTSYDNTGLAAGTYWYRVRAYDAAGVYSDYSEVAEVTVS